MHAYTLPEPTPLERQIVRLVSGSSRQHAVWNTWPNGEFFVRVTGVNDNDEVCVVGRTHPPADNLWRTLLLIDTLRRTGAAKVQVVVPYFAYARQDRAISRGDALTSGTVSRLLASAGASRVVTADLHSGLSIEESPFPIESVGVLPLMAARLRKTLSQRECTVVSPDAGGRVRSAQFADAMGGSPGLAWIEKQRDPRTGRVKMHAIDGEIIGRTAVIVDDMVDTGGTVLRALERLRAKGCNDFFLCATHPVFSGDALRRIGAAGFRRVIVSDTLPLPKRLPRGFEIVSAAEPLARAAASETWS